MVFSKLFAWLGRVSHGVTADLQRWRNLVEPIFPVKGELPVFYAFLSANKRCHDALLWPLRGHPDTPLYLTLRKAFFTCA